MKILIVLDALVRGGKERQALNTTLQLTRMSYDVELVYYRDERPRYEHPALQQAKVTMLLKEGKPLRFVWRLARYIRRGGFDIVQGFGGTPSIYAFFGGKLAGVPIILGGYRVEYREGGVHRFIHRVMSRFLSGWVVNSRAIVDSMVENLGVDRRKSFVVYNGIDPESFVSRLTPAQVKEAVGIEADAPTVSVMARLHPQKNHRLFLESARLILKERPDARFLVVGDGSLRSSLESFAAVLGIADRVFFLGIRSDIPDLLAATDVAVLTSDFEGLANTLVEAMCVGKALVTTAHRGVEELVTDGREGYIVPCGDARAVADKVCRLLSDETLRKRMGEKGRQTVQARFSLKAMATSLLEVYEKCYK